MPCQLSTAPFSLVHATATIFWQRQRARRINGPRIPSNRGRVIEAVEFRGQRCPGGWRLACGLGVSSFKESRLWSEQGNRALASSVFPASNRSDGAGLTGSTRSRAQTRNSTRRRRDKMRRTPSRRWLEAEEKKSQEYISAEFMRWPALTGWPASARVLSTSYPFGPFCEHASTK